MSYHPPVGPTARHLLPGSEYGDGTVGIRAGAHLGLDFQPAVPGGADWIYSVTNGTVTGLITNRIHGSKLTSLYAGHTGNVVEITDHAGRKWSYRHGRDFQVELGDEIRAGQRLCRMSNTGSVTGVHLHLGLRTKAGSFVDPEPVLRANGVWPLGYKGIIGTASTTTTTPTEKEWLDMVSENDLRRIIREETATARWSYKGNQDRDAWAFLINGANAAVNAHEQAIRNKNALEPITVTRSGNRSSHPLKTIISGLDTVVRQNRARLAAIEEAIAQLSKAEGVDLDYTKIEAAAQRGAENALAEGIEVEITATATPKKEG